MSHEAAGAAGWIWIVGWGALLLVATAVRLASWHDVFAPEGIRFLVDSDPYYHVLRAQRMVEEFPRLPSSDSFLNYPFGAKIPWPPLFDGLIAWPAMLLGGTVATVERVAVAVPVVLGLATLPLVGALGAALIGRRAGFIAALLLALLPSHVGFTILGRTDQHAAELLLNCWIFLGFVTSLRQGPVSHWVEWTRPLVLGLGVALAFWNWPGSGFYLVVLALFAGVWHVCDPPDGSAHRAERTLAAGAAVGAALLGVSLRLWAPGALSDIRDIGVTGFHLTLVLLTAAFAGLLQLASRLRPARPGPARRAAEVTLAALVPAAAALAAVPGFRAGVEHGLTTLAASNPWLADIEEFGPLLLGGWDPLSVEVRRMLREFGFALVCMPLGIPAFVRAWRARPGDRVRLAFLAFWGLLLLVLVLVRSRFSLYAAVPAVLWASLSIEELATWLGGSRLRGGPALARAVPALGVLAVIAPALPALAPGEFGVPEILTAGMPAVRWLRTVPSPIPGREAVLASWNLGHVIQYFAGKPVVASPFGTDGGAGAMDDSAAFYFAGDPSAAEAVLERRRVAFVLLGNPVSDLHTLFGFAPAGTRPAVRLRRHWLRGGYLEVTGPFWALPTSRLYFFDGSGLPHAGAPAMGAFRLLHEGPSVNPTERVDESQLKLFGVVPGALLAVENARPSSSIVATVPVRTNQGRDFHWTAFARTDASGRAGMRVPYASGPNGQITAGPYAITDGARTQHVVLSEAQVVAGDEIIVDFSSGGAGAADGRP